VTGDLLSEFDNNTVMDNAVNCGSSGHGIFEDLVPLGEDEVGSDDDAAAFVAFGQQSKKDFHLITRLLNIADVVKDEHFKAIQATELEFQFEIASGAEKLIDKTIGWGEKDTATAVNEFVSNCGSKMSFSSAGQSENEQVLGAIHEFARAELGEQALGLKGQAALQGGSG